MSSKNTSLRSYKVLILLEQKDLDVEELKVLLKENDPTKMLKIVTSSFKIFIDIYKETSEISSNYLDNFNKTIMQLLNSCPNTNIGETINYLKKMQREVLKLNNDDINDTYKELEQQLLAKNSFVYKENHFLFLKNIIYNIKEINYLKQILNTYPHYVNAKNALGKHIVLDIIDYFLTIIDNDGKDIIYYNNVILEFMKRSQFHITKLEVKQYCLYLEKKIENLDKLDKNSHKKLILYKTILDLILNNEITNENIDIINEKYGVTTGFNPLIQKELESLNEKDYIITIDAADTLDMDDAFSIKKDKDCYHLKVYIASVVDLIKQGSSIDKEAYKRVESLYLSDQIIPMLPHELSNNLLSLNTKNYKKVIEYSLDIYTDGSIANFKINKKNILVDRKFSYSSANKKIEETGDGVSYQTLLNLSAVANILKNKNPKKKLYRTYEDILNEQKGIYSSKNAYNNRTPAEIIVEEMMILINSLVASYYDKKGYPFMYRIHQTPEGKDDYIKLMNLKKMIESEYVDKTDYVKIINGLSKMYPPAYYSLNNDGHFGLGLDAYCHITAPIRRYSDILLQRINEDYIFSLPSKEKDNYWTILISEVSKYCNIKMQQNESYQNEYERVKAFLKKK